MSPTLVLLLTFLAVTLLLLGGGSLAYHVYLRPRMLVRDRLRAEFETEGDAARLFREANRFGGDGEHLLARVSQRLERLIEQSGLPLTKQKLLGLSCGAAVAGLLVPQLLSLGWLVAIAAGVVGLVSPLLYVLSRRNARIQKLRRQLPDAFEMMSRTVRVGQTTTAAMQLIADEFDAPIADEFRLCYQQQELGVSADVALRNMASRNGIMELQIFVMGLLVQNRSGGNLAELLDKLGTIVRNRARLQAKVKTLTSEGRMQAAVLIALPICALLALLEIAPDHVTVLLDRPWLLCGIVVAEIVAAVWIRSIVKFEA